MAASKGGKGFGARPTEEKAAPAAAKPPPVAPPPSAAAPAPAARERDAAADDDDDEPVPEVVMNRMLRRIALTTGVPLLVGVLTFPLFYWLKVVQRVDVPEWAPLLVSLSTFGVAGLGISYGVMSTSWDPLREGSLLGWKEARANWPMFMSNVQGKNRN